MLLSLRILNWKSHKDSFLQFKKGTNFILGKMGSGKSSIVDGICFALFGSFPKLSRRQCTLKDLQNFNLENEPTRVELIFQDISSKEKKIYKVIRNLNESKATLYLNEKIICTGNNRVNQQLEKILKVNYDLFTKAVYGEQNNLNYWLELPPAKKKAQLDELLGLDKFETIRTNLIIYLNKQNQKLEQLESYLFSSEVKKLEEDYLLHLKNIDQKEKEILALQKNVEEIFLDYNSISKEYFSQKELYNKDISLEKEIAILYSKLSYLKKELNETKEENISDLEKKKFSLLKEHDDYQTKLADLDKEYKKILAECQQRKAQLEQEKNNKKFFDELEKKKEKLLEGFSNFIELKRVLEQSKEKLQQLRDSIAFLKQRNDSISFNLKSLQAHSQEQENHFCPLCKQRLSKEGINKLVSDYSFEFSSNTSKISSLLLQLKELQNKIKNLEEKSNNIWVIEEQMKKSKPTNNINMLEEMVNNLNVELKNLENEKKVLEQNFENTKKELLIVNQKFDQAKKLENLKKEILTTEKSISDRKKERELLVFSKERMEQTFQKLQEILEKKSMMEQKLRSQKEVLETLNETKKLYLNQINEINKKRDELEKLRNEIDKLKAFEKAIVLTQVQLREHILLKINSALQTLWPFVYPYNDWSAMRVIPSEKGYLIQLLQNDWKDVDVFPSGGERACAAICLRIALSFLLTPSLSWLILDEPTHNLDEIAVFRLAEALNTKLPMLVNQLIVITHDERLVNVGYSQLVKIEREKSTNSFSQVFIQDLSN